MAVDLDAVICDDEESCEKGSESESEMEEYVKAPIDKVGPAGRWIRHRLLASILIGMPPLQAIQRMRTPWRTKAMKICSFLGTEDFYTPLVGLLTWVVDAKLGRLLCLLMGIGFYIAGFVKELLCLPRPPSPPIVPLEKSAFETWGLPSHHAVLGVLIPWYIWFFSLLHFNLSQSSLIVLFVVIALWSISVLFSRLYLGIHSPADIVVGGVVGCLILSVWMKVDSYIERNMSLGNNVGAQALVYALVLLIIHPRPAIKTFSFTETVCMVGVTVGFVIGRSSTGRNSATLKSVRENVTDALETHMGSQARVSREGDVSCKQRLLALFLASVFAATYSVFQLYFKLTPWFTFLWVSCVRLIIGYVLVLVTRVVCKVIFLNMITGAFRLAGVDFVNKKTKSLFYTGYSKSFKLPPVIQDGKKRGRKSKSSDEDSTKLNVDLPVKFVTYVCMGWVCVFALPQICHYLGITV